MTEKEAIEILTVAIATAEAWLENEYRETIGRTPNGIRFIYDEVIPRKNLIRDSNMRACLLWMKPKLEELEKLAKRHYGEGCAKHSRDSTRYE